MLITSIICWLLTVAVLLWQTKNLLYAKQSIIDSKDIMNRVHNESINKYLEYCANVEHHKQTVQQKDGKISEMGRAIAELCKEREKLLSIILTVKKVIDDNVKLPDRTRPEQPPGNGQASTVQCGRERDFDVLSAKKPDPGNVPRGRGGDREVGK